VNANYLLVTADREALGWILQEERTAFPSERRPEVGSLEPGDTVFLYTTRGCYKNPTRDRGRVIGHATVKSQVMHLGRPVSFSGRSFPIGCALTVDSLAPLGHGVELSRCRERLDAFKGSGQSWSIRLRRPLVQLSDNDAQLLRRELSSLAGPKADSLEPYLRWYRDSQQGPVSEAKGNQGS
jgi:hypothetical protein